MLLVASSDRFSLSHNTGVYSPLDPLYVSPGLSRCDRPLPGGREPPAHTGYPGLGYADKGITAMCRDLGVSDSWLCPP